MSNYIILFNAFIIECKLIKKINSNVQQHFRYLFILYLDDLIVF